MLSSNISPSLHGRNASRLQFTAANVVIASLFQPSAEREKMFSQLSSAITVGIFHLICLSIDGFSLSFSFSTLKESFLNLSAAESLLTVSQASSSLLPQCFLLPTSAWGFIFFTMIPLSLIFNHCHFDMSICFISQFDSQHVPASIIIFIEVLWLPLDKLTSMALFARHRVSYLRAISISSTLHHSLISGFCPLTTRRSHVVGLPVSSSERYRPIIHGYQLLPQHTHFFLILPSPLHSSMGAHAPRVLQYILLQNAFRRTMSSSISRFPRQYSTWSDSIIII